MEISSSITGVAILFLLVFSYSFILLAIFKTYENKQKETFHFRCSKCGKYHEITRRKGLR